MRRMTDNPPGFVYFVRPIGAEGPIKIGCSRSPGDRLKHLTQWSPLPLEVIGFLPGSFKDEAFLHRCFYDLRIHYEWFRAASELTDAVAEILRTGVIRLPHLLPKGNLKSERRLAAFAAAREAASPTRSAA